MKIEDINNYNSEKFIDSFKESTSGEIISAAADGVGALKSDTKSEMVKSVSCPTADIIGILELKIACAIFSLLKLIKSSKLPPPLAKIITSGFF